MRAYYDLHVHSCLSPCADDDMTPNNIVNMAILKGLDIIALCDHNSAGNVLAVEKVANSAGLAFIPGVEVATAEEQQRIRMLVLEIVKLTHHRRKSVVGLFLSHI